MRVRDRRARWPELATHVDGHSRSSRALEFPGDHADSCSRSDFGEAMSRRPAEGLRERNKREKLARIKRAARELFAKKGFEDATAREICQRARIGTGTLFLYVRDKLELLFLVFADEARTMLQDGLAATREDMPLPEALMCVFGPFLDFYGRNRELARVIAGELFYRSREPAEMGALTGEYLAVLAQLVERARARGELRTDASLADQVNVLFATYAFHVHGWLSDSMGGRDEIEQSLRRTLVLQIEGLAARRVRRRA
jgi:AcrR family transcriptional regulator